ncbi:hypothetical protein RirG_123960 [Rhizophagus irregularis DAOM 197198w]|uniref:Uncharacterized protein n=1 Tax=Rhizophagus irregularis (strain DAOM 197198w) TaxID=1432141 RepID=A0A015KG32_RHIIW|nr:hypothetical protein RirG_123960 [Rhizophagus irregularis DAOM 197198w]
MATTTRSKHKQMEQMAKEAVVEKENLAQDVIEESEDDSDYEAKDSHKLANNQNSKKHQLKLEDQNKLGMEFFELNKDNTKAIVAAEIIITVTARAVITVIKNRKP